MVDPPLASKDLCSYNQNCNCNHIAQTAIIRLVLIITTSTRDKRDNGLLCRQPFRALKKKSMLKLWTEWFKDCWDLLHATALICVKSQIRRLSRNLVAAPVKSHFKVLLMAFSWYHHHHHHDRQQHHDDFQNHDQRQQQNQRSHQPLLVCFNRLQRRSVAIVGLAQISGNE